MSYDEMLSKIFQPNYVEVFTFVLVFFFWSVILFAIANVILDLGFALIRRFIWPGKKSQDEKEAP